MLKLVSHWHCPRALRSAPLLQLGSFRLALRPTVSAPELIKSFAETAPPDVQQAVRATVVSLLGNLPPHMYDTSIASTGQNVASLMYSMQMTGYMFRSAEYRRSLMESLSAAGESSGLLPPEAGEVESELPNLLPQVSGMIKVNLSADPDGMQAEVDASAYMAELRSEVEQLRGDLVRSKEASQEAQGGGLLAFIQSIGRDKISDLTSSVSEDVLDAMRLLIENILAEAGVGGEQFFEVSGVKLRELLVWQLITGYKLRELEAKEELNQLM